ncbi:hypothetical protein [Brumimicrobium aurantiacum]|uniref:Uncharacterized protein n=1 Tax=Brumimicrobium aurantiacum TaxID=1737063 RepID=A0A3E1EZ96_9FLAO|nr:hypothetical protein [Brumimicrobium aurantiacum]RFC54874.1 hypothetical protein DXU93_03370 [Brumimicrobium aurantiacum]
MNNIDEIKQEITEERLCEGWVFELNNSKEFKKGAVKKEEKLSVYFKRKLFSLKLEKKEQGLIFRTISTVDYTAFIRYLFEVLEKNRGLELHEMKRNY